MTKISSIHTIQDYYVTKSMNQDGIFSKIARNTTKTSSIQAMITI